MNRPTFNDIPDNFCDPEDHKYIDGSQQMSTYDLIHNLGKQVLLRNRNIEKELENIRWLGRQNVDYNKMIFHHLYKKEKRLKKRRIKRFNKGHYS